MELRRLLDLVDSFLTEDVGLTKGSQQVMANKKLVANLADAIRDNAASNPSTFPSGFTKQSRKESDEALAQWFLGELDKIEQQGYEGVQYSRNGVNSLWLVNRYIAGSHEWEDILGTASMNLAKWYYLKNRNMLDSAHNDLQKFKGIRDVGQYMVYHYEEKLKDLEAHAKAQAMKKSARAIKLVDNDDYKIYIILNRNASCLYGLGSNWCTANTGYAGHFHRYSERAMLLQMYPKAPEEVSIANTTAGKEFTGNERYQFDGGGAFMNLADQPANPKEIQKKYPYLYYDIVTAINGRKAELEEYIKQASEDPTLQDKDSSQVKVYDLDAEIKKLDELVRMGYLIKEPRPKQKPAAAEEPQDVIDPQLTLPQPAA